MRVGVLSLFIVCLGMVGALRAVASGPPGGTPTITIVSPPNGTGIDGSTITIRVAVHNFKLVPPVLISPSRWKTIPLLPGKQGHIHYVLDNVANLVLNRDVTTQLTHMWTHVAPGEHTVIAYLATSQHAPFPGARSAEIHVYVGRQPAGGTSARVTGQSRSTSIQARPSIAITDLRTGRTHHGVKVVVQVAVHNFKLVPPILRPPAEWKTIPLLPGNQGHIHYVLDNVSNLVLTRDVTSRLSHPWTDVSPGWHTILAYLATSQHQLFPGTSAARARIYVPATSAPHGRARVRVVLALPKTGGGDPAPSGSQLSDHRARASGKAIVLRAEADAGRSQAQIGISPADPRHVVVRLWRDGRPLVQRQVTITFSRLFHAPPTRQGAQGKGNAYSATLPTTRPGWWEVQVQPSASSGLHTIPFLLHISSSPGVYPLFSPPGAERASVSLPLGQQLADVHIAIGAVGDSTIQIALRGTTGRTPSSLRLAASMLDMVMGTSLSTARKTGVRAYTGRVFLSMPGIWRVDLAHGPDHASAALLLGRSGD